MGWIQERSRELRAGSEQHLRMATSHGGAWYAGWSWLSRCVKCSPDRVHLQSEPVT